MPIRRCHISSAIFLAIHLLLLASPGAAQTDHSKLFRKTDTMVPMRDGVRLHTEIYAPRKIKEPLPFIFERTPYGLEDDKQGNTKLLGRLIRLIYGRGKRD